jgi:subtilisin family serine protease
MRLRGNQLATLTIVLVVSALLVAAAGRGRATRLHLRTPASSWEGLVGGPRPQVALGQRMIVVLRSPSLSTRLARDPKAGPAEQKQWTKDALSSQRAVFDRLAAVGIDVRPEFRYTRVLNGFAAPLDGAALAQLEADKAVAGVYSVRAAFPATTPGATGDAGLGDWTGALLPGFDGGGVTIALLDTGVDLSHRALRNHVLPGADIVGGSPSADARSRPGDASEVEEHGTEMASLLVGTGTDLTPIAPGATIYPIRVAGWQRDAGQSWSIFGRTDQILAGLERAVDPNRDGDTADAARIALVPLAEPFAGFPDEPLARAAAGATRIGTLVVAPAGNDGPAASVFGSVSGPGAAPAALTVGAADLRTRAREARVVIRTGLEVVLDRPLPLAGSVGPTSRIQLPLAWVASSADTAPGLGDFFDHRGFSRVAGHGALMEATSTVELAVERAARAGASAVLLYGAGPPPGALGAANGLAVPVVTLPRRIGPSLAEAVRRGARVFVTIGPTRVVGNASAGRVAPFSSHGLAFDGKLKPDLIAPGVGLAAAEPGFNDKGVPRFGSVNGSSVAAAIAAGAAAVLAQARPRLDAAQLKALLVASARGVGGDPLTAQGAGLIDVGNAASREVVSDPPEVSLGPISEPDRVQGEFVLENVSSRRVILGLAPGPPSPRHSAAIRVTPTRVELAPGAHKRVRIRVRVALMPGALGAIQGVVVVTPYAGGAIRIPWTIGTRPAGLALLQGVAISEKTVTPSDTTPVVLAFQAGRLLDGQDGPSVQPVSRLDVELYDETETQSSRLGLVARLRDLLPGRYAFGLTGRDPHGRILPPGRYRLRLVAYPTVRGPATRRSVVFSVVGPNK